MLGKKVCPVCTGDGWHQPDCPNTPPPKPWGRRPGSKNSVIRKDARYPQIIAMLVANPEMTHQEIAEKLGVSERSVTNARYRAIKEKIVEKSYFARKDGKKPEFPGTTSPNPVPPIPELPGEEIPDELKREMQKVAKKGRLTHAESLDALATIFRSAKKDGHHKLAMDAIQNYHKLQDRVTPAQLGPRPPLTPEERIQRTQAIVDVVGPEILANAVARAFTAQDIADFEGFLAPIRARMKEEPSASQVPETSEVG